MSPTPPHRHQPDLDYLLNEFSHHLDAPTSSRNTTTATTSRYAPYHPLHSSRRRHMTTTINTSPDRPRHRTCNYTRAIKDLVRPIIIESDEQQKLDLFPSIPEQPALFSSTHIEEPIFFTNVSDDDTVFSDFALLTDSSSDSFSEFEPNTVDDDFVLIP